MNKIDVSNWADFKVCDLFTITGSTTTPLEILNNYGKGKYPYITTQATNNGIAGYFNHWTEEGNCLTVDSAVLGTCFYQEKNFSASDHVEILRPKDFNLTKNIGLFFSVVLNKTSKLYGYAYNSKRSQIALQTEEIMLPVKNGKPDYEFMDGYISVVIDGVNSIYSHIHQLIHQCNIPINLDKFERFNLYDEQLFTIDSGSKLDKIKMKQDRPTINFVGRSKAYNGVTDCVDEIHDLKPYDSGLLTLSLGGAYLGSCFIQEKQFYTSQNVIVLKPRKEMSFYCKQYISCMIFKESQTYYKAFIDELNRHINTDFSILLPVTENKKIDFVYMENYMKLKESACLNNFKNFKNI